MPREAAASEPWQLSRVYEDGHSMGEEVISVDEEFPEEFEDEVKRMFEDLNEDDASEFAKTVRGMAYEVLREQPRQRKRLATEAWEWPGPVADPCWWAAWGTLSRRLICPPRGPLLSRWIASPVGPRVRWAGDRPARGAATGPQQLLRVRRPLM